MGSRFFEIGAIKSNSQNRLKIAYLLAKTPTVSKMYALLINFEWKLYFLSIKVMGQQLRLGMIFSKFGSKISSGICQNVGDMYRYFGLMEK